MIKYKKLSISQIRKFQYKYKFKKNLKVFKIDILNFFKNPYTTLKSIFYIEVSSIIIFFSQFTKITPNQLTFVYILMGVLGGIFLASNNSFLIFVSLVFFFTKGCFDWADGSLAKIKNKVSEIGNLLDIWGGLIGYYSLIFGLGLYLYNKNQDIHFIYFNLVLFFLKSIDIKSLNLQIFASEYFRKKRNLFNLKNLSKNNNKRRVLLLSLFIKLFDDRARSVDLILFLIFIDNFYYEIYFIKYIFYFIFVKQIIMFVKNFYYVIFK